MGADLYIESDHFKALRAYHREKFEALIKLRNAIRVPGYVGHKVIAYVDGDVKYAQLDRDTKAWLRTDDGKAYVTHCKAIDKNMASEPGYFRDSYNYSSLFWNLGLSWWALARDGSKVQLIDEDGHISVADAKLIRAVIKTKAVRPLVQGVAADADSADRQAWIDKMSAKELADWNKYFVSKKRKFIKFLSDAIKNNAIIYASV